MANAKLYSANGKFFVTIDKAAFLAEVQKYMDLSPVVKEWEDVKKLQWPEALVPPAFWTTIKELNEVVSVVCSAVEVAKQNIIKEQDPDGSKGAKFDREIALATAVQMVSTLIRFEGIVGSIVNKVWKPLINVLVSIYVTQQPSDWLSIALKILAIALK